jgi:Trypsin
VHVLRRSTAIVLASLASLVLFAFPASAVVGGTADTDNIYESVGLLEVQFEPDEWFGICSGTLIEPDVVLTAAHCTDFLMEVGEDGLGPDDLRLTFDPEPDDGSIRYATDHIVVHPDWFEAPPCLGNSKHLCLAPPAEDIALVFLATTVADVDPSPVADLGYLDTLDLRDETFTVAGYGVDGFATGGLFSPHAVIIDDGIRSFRDVAAIPAQDAFPDRFLKIGKSTCFGDSGGPVFHEDIVVGINAWTFSLRCDGPNFGYRTDSQVAQDFLAANL